MAEMEALLNGLTDEYFLDPASKVLTLPTSKKPDLCLVLTSIFHAISQARSRNGWWDGRRGKPEEAIRIAFQLSADDADDAYRNQCASIASYTTTNDDLKVIYHLYASDFWQRAQSVTTLWSGGSVIPQRMVSSSNGTRHPRRPVRPSPGTTLYSRFSPTFDTTFTLKVADVTTNLQKFHEWHNSDRVNAFWGERGTMEHHKEYLEKQLGDPHVTPTIAYFGDAPFAYFELYYASEDAIAPFANPDAFDRGFHALVGEQAYRGPNRVKFWISSVSHYLFLADPRTQRVMLEPRVDNVKFISYLNNAGYVVEKEFNFPHKRAALVSITREKFFECQGVAT